MNSNNSLIFKNEYTIPENTLPYAQMDTTPKENWNAKWIWDFSDGSEENVWMCFRKTVDILEVPENLIADISADSKYWLYINGEMVVFEESAKRGPTDKDGYYDSVDITPYLQKGKNIICTLVWYWGSDTSYSSTDSGFVLKASIPKDTNAVICIPYDDNQAVKYNEKLIYQNGRFSKIDGIEFIEISDGYIIFSADYKNNIELIFESK